MDSRIAEMALLWFLLLVALVSLLQYRSLDRKSQKGCALVFCLVVSFLSAVRSIGLDLPNYEMLYHQYLVWFSPTPEQLAGIFDRAYEPLNYFIAYFAGPEGFRLYIFICAAFTNCIALLLSCRRKNPLLYFAIFILLNLFFVDQTRQFFAEGFILLSFLVSKPFFAIVVALCAGLAHYGTLPAAALTIFRNHKVSQVGLLMLGLTIGLLAFLVIRVFDFGSLGGIETRLEAYTGGEFYSATNAVRFLSIFFYPITMIVFVAIFARGGLVKNADMHVRYAYNNAVIASIAFVSLLLFLQSDVLSSRLFGALSIGNFLLIGYFLENKGGRQNISLSALWLVVLNVVSSAYYFYMFVR